MPPSTKQSTPVPDTSNDLRRCPKCHGKGLVFLETDEDLINADCLRCHGAGFLPPTDDDD